MAKNLTPVSEYTGDVTVPTGGDARTAASVETPIQTLTNRAAYAKSKLDALAQAAYFNITGTVSSAAGKFTIAESLDPSDAYSVASNEITLPEVGTYLMILEMTMSSSDTSNPRSLSAWLEVGGDVKATVQTARFSASGADVVSASCVALVTISSTSEVVTVNSALGTTSITAESGKCRLAILRLL
jgi:hypothetical protein